MNQTHTEQEAIKVGYESELDKCEEFGLIERIPAWVQRDITVGDLLEIVKHGCDSGSYMPAVENYAAQETMGKHGDEIAEWLEQYGDPIESCFKVESTWSSLCVKVLSRAVEAYALTTLQQLESDDRLGDEFKALVSDLL